MLPLELQSLDFFDKCMEVAMLNEGCCSVELADGFVFSSLVLKINVRYQVS